MILVLNVVEKGMPRISKIFAVTGSLDDGNSVVCLRTRSGGL